MERESSWCAQGLAGEPSLDEAHEESRWAPREKPKIPRPPEQEVELVPPDARPLSLTPGRRFDSFQARNVLARLPTTRCSRTQKVRRRLRYGAARRGSNAFVLQSRTYLIPHAEPRQAIGSDRLAALFEKNRSSVRLRPGGQMRGDNPMVSRPSAPLLRWSPYTRHTKRKKPVDRCRSCPLD